MELETMSQEDKLEMLKDSLLSKKEKNEEKFVDEFMTSFEKNDFQPAASADLNQQEKLQQAQLKLADRSIILAHRFSPFLKQYVANKEQKLLNEKFAVIKSKKTSIEQMAESYRVCFNTWINAKDDVHFKASDRVGNIDILHAFTLTFFSFLTNRRQPGDNMLQLVISGLNSCGKTMIFENPLLEVVHMVTTEKGVSRFNFESKSTMLLHDVNLTNLVKSADCDRLKAIARGEPVPTKTRGSVQTVPSVFAIITSNQHLFTHTFPTVEKSKKTFHKVYKSDLKPSKNVHPGDIAALQARFLEAYVRSRPEIEERFIPQSENFTRIHAIVGLFSQVMDILCLYEKNDFKSQYYYLYPIGGLCKNLHLMPKESIDELRKCLFELMTRYELDEEQIDHCCKDMTIVLKTE